MRRQRRCSMMKEITIKDEPDLDVLKCVQGRLIRVKSVIDPVLAIEIIAGPYKGVTFWFSKFTLDPSKATADGMVPVKFECKVYQSPEGFVHDESFDMFCGEIFYAWITYLKQVDMPEFFKMPTVPGIH